MITVYSKTHCPQCVMTKNVLNKQGLKYNEINLDAQPKFVAVIHELGYKSLPVVAYQDKHWSGFRPDLISAL